MRPKGRGDKTRFFVCFRFINVKRNLKMELFPQRPDQDTLCTVQYTAPEDRSNFNKDVGILAFSSKGLPHQGLDISLKTPRRGHETLDSLKNSLLSL
jgi:hypothetical protein